MTAAHYAEAELDDDGTPIYVRFTCTGGPADICHQWCVSCEESCTGTPVLWPTATEQVAQAPSGEHQWKPMPPDGSSCRITDWLDAIGWEDSGWTEDDDQITAEQLRPGRHLIEEEWTGDDYIWRYPTEVTA